MQHSEEEDVPPTVEETDDMEVAEAEQRPPAAKKVCVMCGVDNAIYTCPSCQRRTCSALCVRGHKTAFSCSGERSVVQFVPLAQFDDSHFKRDFHFLEDCQRVVTRAERELPGPSTPQHTAQSRPSSLSNPALTALRDAARRRGVLCQIVSEGMAKRRQNTSRYDALTDTVVWRCEFRFHNDAVRNPRDAPSFVVATEWGNERNLLGDVLKHCAQVTDPRLPCFKIQRGYNNATAWVQSQATGGTVPVSQPIDVVTHATLQQQTEEDRIPTTSEALNVQRVASFLARYPNYIIRCQAERLGNDVLYFDLSPKDTIHAALRKVFFVNEFPVFVIAPEEATAVFPLIDEANKERIRESFRKRTRADVAAAEEEGGDGEGQQGPVAALSLDSRRPFPCRQYLSTMQCGRGSTCPYLHCNPTDVPPCRYIAQNLICPHGMKCCFRH